MRGRAWVVVAAAVTAWMAAHPADGAAQRRRGVTISMGGGVEDRGSPAFSLEVGSETGTFAGVWARLGDRASLGVEGSLFWNREEAEDPGGGERTYTTSRLGVGPSLKLYLDDGVVAPFLYGHAGLVHVETDAETGAGDAETSGNEVLVRAAAGAEWFASSRFSVAGNVGLRWRTWEDEQDLPGGGEAELDRSSLSLFTSGIAVTFHF